ncbi:MAG: peptidoglycan-binding protein [Bacteroidota bacterium]
MIDKEKIQRSSRQGAIMSAIGFIIIVISFLLAGYNLNKVNNEIKTANKKIDSISFMYKKWKDKLAITYNEIDSLNNVISKLSAGQSYIDLGIKEYYSGNYLKAISFYDSAINKYEKNSAAYALKGQTEIVLKKFDNAESDLLKSLSIDSLRPQTYYSLIHLYIKSDKLDNAFYYLRKILDIAPQYINQIKYSSEMSNLVIYAKFMEIDAENKKRLGFIQLKLKELGYYKGILDIYPGKETIDAIIKYQKDHNFKVTGSWDLITLNRLKYN